MAAYMDFIAQNVAPANARQIGVYSASGARVGSVPLGRLAQADMGNKLYSFGVVSDIHLQYDTATDDYRNALAFYAQSGVDFVCCCGDTGETGATAHLQAFRDETAASGMTVYATTGNHDVMDGAWIPYEPDVAIANWRQNTGLPVHYTVSSAPASEMIDGMAVEGGNIHRDDIGDDVFVFFGLSYWDQTQSGSTQNPFTDDTLQWLYETLEANRNRRVFLFQHLMPWDGSGDVLDAYPFNLLDNRSGQVFLSLMRHYKNVVWFHGHSHVRFSGQEYGDMANIDTLYGMYSLHIPSLYAPRTGDAQRTSLESESEGYVVDVYQTGIHLRGRDFIKGEFLPIASYWLDTTLQTIEAGTYTDSTGTIAT